MKLFIAYGPFDIPLDKHGKVAKALKAFWARVNKEKEGLSEMRGVYVFAMRASTGLTPIYVGKAGRTRFRTEAFGPHKRHDHYNPALHEYLKGTPVIFFVTHPLGRGAINRKLIDEVETFLIGVAWKKNSELSNIRKKPKHTWAIRGVVRASQGQPSSSARALRKALGV